MCIQHSWFSCLLRALKGKRFWSGNVVSTFVPHTLIVTFGEGSFYAGRILKSFILEIAVVRRSEKILCQMQRKKLKWVRRSRSLWGFFLSLYKTLSLSRSLIRFSTRELFSAQEKSGMHVDGVRPIPVAGRTQKLLRLLLFFDLFFFCNSGMSKSQVSGSC